MSLLDSINFVATIVTFGCVSFAASNFGIKLGKLMGFKNTSGYKYISDANYKDKLYDDIVKVALKEKNAPEWAKNKNKLQSHCKKYQNSLRHWNDTLKYCIVQNKVRHKLIENGVDLKEPASTGCTEELLNTYSDGKDSLSFLIGKKECTATTSPSN